MEVYEKQEKLYMENKLPVILIIVGVLAFVMFYIYTKILNNIPTYNNFAGVIGISTWVPIFIGVLIFGVRGIKKHKHYSYFLVWISIIFFLAFLILSTIEIFQVVFN